MWRESSGLRIGLLCLVCLVFLQLQATNPPCSQMMTTAVQSLIESPQLKVNLGGKLYTPSLEDYKNCPSSTFQCFAEEMRVLTEEIEHVKKSQPFKIDNKLKKLAAAFNQTENMCPQCEVYTEQDVRTFLSNLNTVLTLMNSQYCTRSHIVLL